MGYTKVMTNSTQELPNIFSRQPDVQFDAMERLLEAAKLDMEGSREVRVPSNDILFGENNGIIGIAVDTRESTLDPIPQVNPLTHYSMLQSCRMAKLDSNIPWRLRQAGRLDLAIDNLNVLFPKDKNDKKTLLINQFGAVRAINGADYSRLWDYKMFEQVTRMLIPSGFIPAKTANGCGQLLRAGQTALFRGDQTSFGFFFTNEAVQATDLGALRQGIMIWNSEVGARSFGFSTFYFREDSGTFLIWDRLQEKRKRFVHRGDISHGFREYLGTVRHASTVATGSREQDFAIFNKSAQTPFAASFDEAVEKLNKYFDMPIGQAIAVVKASRLPQNNSGPDLSVWRISLGIAYEAAQTSRAESMVDDSVVANKVISRLVK